MKVIVGKKGYPEKRNIITDNSNQYLDYRLRNIWTWINAFRQRLLRRNKLFIFRPIPLFSSEKKNIIHLFNEVSTGPGHWVATFETELPRVLPVSGIAKFQNPELARELRYISSSRCRGIIAISSVTRQIQLQLLEHYPAERKTIEPKLHVLHPPQQVLQEKILTTTEGPLTFIFVGNEFYRKGGAEVVLAFSQLFRENIISGSDVRINIVGDTSKIHNVVHGEFQDDDKFRDSIQKSLREIPIFQRYTLMENYAVLELMKSSDVGLLPTWQDTYGFSVLEMQACGCPVITTNVRALPEINPEEVGWLIQCPLNSMSELTVNTLEDKTAIRNAIVMQLKSYITSVIHDRNDLAIKSTRATERIRREHNPDRFQEKLNALYGEMLMTGEDK